MSVRESVEAALQSTTIDPRDAGAVALLLRYADHLDAPGIPAGYRKYLNELHATLEVLGGSRQAYDALTVITTALSAQMVASDLGPKLLAGLSALGLTLAGRGEKGKVEQRAADPAAAKLDELRAKRAARQSGAQALDPTAP